jgi:hypothetical protein
MIDTEKAGYGQPRRRKKKRTAAWLEESKASVERGMGWGGVIHTHTKEPRLLRRHVHDVHSTVQTCAQQEAAVPGEGNTVQGNTHTKTER